MKRVVAVLLALVMVCGAALADEILFRGHPWGVKFQVVQKELDEIEDWYSEERHLVDWMEQDFEYSKEPNYYAVYGYTGNNEFKVAGYEVSILNLAMLYSTTNGEISRELNDSELFGASYSLIVMDSKAAYDDLKNKLTGLYGEGTEEKENYGDGKYTTWNGDNATSVRLSLGNSDDITIYYGRTNLEIIKNLNDAITAEQQAAIQNDVSGL